MNLNDYAKECYNANINWWKNPKTGEFYNIDILLKLSKIALMHSELSEALEGERKNLMDDKIPERKMAEVELVDCLIRIFDYAGALGYDLQGAYTNKMAYNLKRADHKLRNRIKKNGKQF